VAPPPCEVFCPALLATAKRSHHAHLSRIARWLSDQIIQVRQGLRVFTKPRQGAGAIAAQLAAWAVQTLAAYDVDAGHTLAYGIFL
jgi:hypothetical protein